MAINFSGSSSQYLQNASPPTFALPITIAAWFRPTDNATGQAVVSLSTSGGSARLQLACAGNVGGDPIRAASFNSGGTNAVASSTVGYTLNTWQHGCAVFASQTSRTIYLNGANSATDTASNDPSIGSVNLIRIGNAVNGGTNIAHFSGGIAEVAIYSVALTAAEAASLAAGVSPLLVRPDALIAYYPLTDITNPAPDFVGRYAATLNNAPPIEATSPRIFRPAAQILRFASAGGGSVASGAGSSAGAATVAGVGASTAATVGSSAGSATATGVGASTAATTGTSAGSATATGVGATGGSLQSGAGTSAGTSSAGGVGASTAATVGTSAGTSTASAVGTTPDAATPVAAIVTLAQRSAVVGMTWRRATCALSQRTATIVLEAA